jgi:hypothetical protein
MDLGRVVMGLGKPIDEVDLEVEEVIMQVEVSDEVSTVKSNLGELIQTTRRRWSW